jgi:peptidoglycan-associated lipoprotein
MNRARSLLLASLALSLLFAAGCRPDWPQCKNDKHCATDPDGNEVNFTCVEGTCRECVGNEDCPAGYECENFSCVPEPECRTDGDCPGNLLCRNNECRPECTTDAECASGMKCEGNQCVPDVECTVDGDCQEGYECARGQCIEMAVACEIETVHFEYDSHTLTPDARRILAANAECLRQKQGRITLEGHCDERGSQEYNLALGERRANSVRRYLMDLGIPSDRLNTVSYGKERPLDRRSDEDAWSRNRRVEFRVQEPRL